MEYKTFNKTGEPISLLGFGMMRLPVVAGQEGKIDEDEAIRLIRYAIDSGVNYVDTAYMYHGGKSEVVLGKALKDGYREKVFLADKMPLWMAEAAGGMDALFEEKLARLDVDVIDFYLDHGLSHGLWKLGKKLEVMSFLEKKKTGRKRSNISDFRSMMILLCSKRSSNAYDWDFCQIQLNYMDSGIAGGRRGTEIRGGKRDPCHYNGAAEGWQADRKPA